VTGGRGGAGFSLVEALLALAILGLFLTISMPAFGAALSRARVAAAARDMASEMARLRAEAIASRRSVGLRFSMAGGRRRFAVYADGDGDGIRADDIAAGRDPLLIAARDLPSRWEGIDFGLLEAAIPDVPPASGVLMPGSDPVRFGSSDTISFTPWGTASSGTLYISDSRDSVFAVVLYGHTGRIRTWRFDRDLWRWTR
jgi:Tfp pilus assembly protein FimT